MSDMGIGGVGSSAAKAASAGKDKTLSQADFLSLLTQQMRNQDPTKPMDSTEYVAQLATFSQVAQTVQTNSKLDQLLQTSALAQAGNIIGHSIISADGNTTGTVSSVRLTTDGLVAILQNGQEVTMQSGVVIQ